MHNAGFAHDGVDHGDNAADIAAAPPAGDGEAAVAPPAPAPAPAPAGDAPPGLEAPDGGAGPDGGANGLGVEAPPAGAVVAPAAAAAPEGVAAEAADTKVGTESDSSSAKPPTGGGVAVEPVAETVQPTAQPAVDGGGRELPFTGAESVVLLACAFMLLASGFMVRLSARRQAAAEASLGKTARPVDIQFAWRHDPPGMA